VKIAEGQHQGTNVYIIEVQKEKRQKGTEKFFEEIMTNNSPRWREEMDM
jgi:hypothetical protein